MTTACCEGLIGEPDGTEQTCGRPGATLRRTACVHEHVDVGYICDLCAARPNHCGECFRAGCTDCLVTIQNLAA